MKVPQNWLKVLPLGFALTLCLLVSATRAHAAFDAAQTFKQTCSACHTVGKGVLIGPDLKGVTERREEAWLLSFIPSPAKKIASGDPIAVELFNKHNKITMPDQALAPDEIRAMLKFIAAGGPSSMAPSVKSALEATADDMKAGRDIFVGTKKLSKGGTACLSCHSADSYIPVIAARYPTDLTQIFSKQKDAGLDALLKTPATLVMKQTFEGKPLTDEEIFQIKSFLYQVDRDGRPGQNYHRQFLFIGLGAAVVILAVLDFIRRKRREDGGENS